MKIISKVVQCASCGSKLKLGLSAGRNIVCPACHHPMRIGGRTVSSAAINAGLNQWRESVSLTQTPEAAALTMKDLPLTFGNILRIVIMVFLAVSAVVVLFWVVFGFVSSFNIR